MKTINWLKFGGSSHCEEGLAAFAVGELSTYKEFKGYFLPYMKDVAKEVEVIKNSKIGITKAKRRAARAFKRICRLSISEAYGRDCWRYNKI